MIKVLIVDDSQVARMTISEILEYDPEIEVIGTASNGLEALAFLEKESPDVITMDVIMPEMNGFETTRRIMELRPKPIVIVTSSYKTEEVEKTFEAMEAGAVTILEKPAGISNDEYEKNSQNLRDTVKLMAGVKVVRRWPRNQQRAVKKPGIVDFSTSAVKRKIVAIGASTGGPMALQEILSQFPADFPVPVVIVQHIGGEFIDGMLYWLEKSLSIPITVARDGELLESRHAYIAPDGRHMEITAGRMIRLVQGPTENGSCPSVSFLFRSVARTYGDEAFGVILTGMGRDGADGLKEMKNMGAVTIAQDEQSCIVYGMPGAAVQVGAVQYVLPLKEISYKIINLLGVTPAKEKR